MELSNNVKTYLIGLAVTLGLGISWLGYALISKIGVGDGGGLVPLLGVIMIILAAMSFGGGVDILIEIMGTADDRDTVTKILWDFPPADVGETPWIESRIVKLLLIKGEEIKMLETLKMTLDERKSA